MDSILGYLKKPLFLGIVAGILGFGLGLLWGWGIQPVQWTDASPSLLQSSYQEDYMRMTIDSYGLNGNKELALSRWGSLGETAASNLEKVQQNPGSQDPTLIMQFSNLVSSPVAIASPSPEPGTPAETGTSSLGQFLLIAFAILAVLVVVYALFKYLKPNFHLGGGRQSQPVDRGPQPVEKSDFATGFQQAPLAQFVTTYMSGDDLFDDSFSIDSASGEFLGECGIGISETIGVGDPKKVSAFELWMFDKNDIQTVTKVLMSAHAYNDPATYQRLQAKGEPIWAENNLRVTLETATLQMIATITEIEYGQSALPENSFFNRLTLELAIWQKNAPIG
jgi:hypothetical protein